MVSIAKNKERELDFKSLCEDIISKSKNAINDKKVLAHSVLLYTGRHGHLARMLNDDYFYNALNEASGRYLNIYHAKSEIDNSNEDSFRSIGFMTSFDVNVYRDNKEYNSIIDKFRQEYNITANINNPVLFFFTSKDAERFGNTYTVIQRGDNADDYYNELIAIIESVTNAIENVIDENIENQNEILNLAIENIKNYKFKRVIQRVTNSSIFQIIGFLKPA